MARFFGFLMIFVAAFAATTEVVAVEQEASWGTVKSQIVNNPAGPAGKLVVSAEKAGDVRYLVYRQPIGGNPRVIGDEYGLLTNLSFRSVPGIDHIYVQQDGKYLLIVMDVDAALIIPEAKEFGLVYALGNNRVQAKTRFFGYDAERTQYMVQFWVPYTGSPAQEHILGLRSGEAVMSFWYVPEMAGDYDSFITTAVVHLVGMEGGISISLEPIGSLPSDEPELLWHQGIAGVMEMDRGVFGFPVRREPGVRFFRIRTAYYDDPKGRTGKLWEWIVQLPFVEELDVVLSAPDVAHVGLPRK